MRRPLVLAFLTVVLSCDVAVAREVVHAFEPGTGTDRAAAQEQVVTNNHADCSSAWVAPLPGEEAHRAVARLTPPGPRFEVTRIRVALDNGGAKGAHLACSTALAHRVEIFVGDGPVPPAEPVILARWEIAPSHTSTPLARYERTLPHPLLLEMGQSLFIAVQMAGQSPRMLCPAACAGPTVEPSRNYWSNRDVPPYPWVTLASLNLPYNLRFDAVGRRR